MSGFQKYQIKHHKSPALWVDRTWPVSYTHLYPALDEFLGKILEKKPLSEYGMTKDQVAEFAKSTVDNQQRLLANNYVPLTEAEIAEIFENLY